jgi:acyl-coenzyme A thioesterase PaaI-like protein
MDLDPNLFGPGQPCFGCAPDHPTGFRLRFAKDSDSVTTRFTPTSAHQGPPGLMHGGLVMTLADEIGAWTVIGLLTKFGFTADFAGRLKKPVRIGLDVTGKGTLVKETSRVVTVAVGLEQAGDKVLDAELSFVLVDASGAERLLGGPLPEAWRSFCR